MHGVFRVELKLFVVFIIVCCGNVLSCDIFGELRHSSAIQTSKLFKEIIPISLIGCAKQCLTRPTTCRSFNYFRSLNMCQLSFSNNSRFVIEDLISVHSLIDGWTKSLVGGCAAVTCTEGYTCNENKNVTCQLSECGLIPQYQNMNTEHFDRTIGSGVLYTCSENFIQSGGDLTSYCNNDGTWAMRSGNCVPANCSQILSYTYYPQLNMCYSVRRHQLNLNEAQSTCMKDGASLLKIDNLPKQAFIRQMSGGSDIKTVYSPKQHTDTWSYTYNLLSNVGYVVSTTSIKLQVKACSDVHVGLMSENDPSTSKMYEIVIGGWKNTKVVIRRSKQGKKVAECEKSPLNCNSYHTVEVLWGSYIIQIQLEGELLCDYQENSPLQVNYIGVTGGIWADVETRVNIGRRFWIDGTYRNNKWQYDSMEEMIFTNWDKDQPDENKVKDVGVVVNKNAWNNKDLWWDEDSQNKHYFICEYRH